MNAELLFSLTCGLAVVAELVYFRRRDMRIARESLRRMLSGRL